MNARKSLATPRQSTASGKRFFKLTLAYDGTAYAGWQAQRDQPTVQTALEAALQQITRQHVRVAGSSRTDAGVHALGQVVSFAVATHLSPAVLMRALNANLPQDIVVRDLVEAPAGFHAIRDSLGKRYRYAIHDDRRRDVFSRRHAWHIPDRLDAEAMHEAAQALVGRHDFASFEAAGSRRVSSIRTITEIVVERRPVDQFRQLVIEVEADGFLYNMVRTIAGTLAEVGRGKQAVSWPGEVLAARWRPAAGMTAPPQGLFLLHVFYDLAEWPRAPQHVVEAARGPVERGGEADLPRFRPFS